jgi:putative flippase GtrA
VISAFGRFAVVGVIGFVVDAGGTWVLIFAGGSPFVARVPALIAAMITTWLLNRRLTFEVAHAKSGAELARYLVVASTSALLNYLLYSALVALHVLPVLAVGIATVALMLGSFFAYRRLVFR